MKKLSILSLFTALFLLYSCGKQEFTATKAPQLSSINQLTSSSAQLCAQHTLIKPKVDILIIWDNTSSFNFVTTASKNSLNQLITNVSENFDYHALSVPLVATSGDLGEAVLIASDASSISGTASTILKTKDQAIASLGFSPGAGANEMGLDRAANLILNNRSNGIFRDGAYTLIVMMSNEDDKGCESYYGYNTCAPIDKINYRQPKINKLLCLRGNVDGVNCSSLGVNSPLNSTMMRFMSIVPLTSCSSGLNKINVNYSDASRQIYSKPYNNGWPTSSDALSPDIAGFPDSYNLCTIDFSHIFDGVNSAIKQTLLKHVYDYWPVAGAYDSLDPDTLIVTRDDGKVLTRHNLSESNISDGYTFDNQVYNQQPTRFFPTAGEPFTGKLIHLFGSNGNDKLIYPQCLSIKYDPIKSTFGYIYLTHGEPLVSSIQVMMNGVAVPQSSTNGWDYMGLQFISGLNQSLKVIDLPAGTTSGYIIRFNGSYQKQNSVNSSTSVNVFYNPK